MEVTTLCCVNLREVDDLCFVDLLKPLDHLHLFAGCPHVLGIHDND